MNEKERKKFLFKYNLPCLWNANICAIRFTQTQQLVNHSTARWRGVIAFTHLQQVASNFLLGGFRKLAYYAQYATLLSRDMIKGFPLVVHHIRLCFEISFFGHTPVAI
jgi:hypothetical protein